MTNKKSTKRALLLSALSLLMCVSMLVGSTFAWFTDSVTSGQNTIQAGNLDIVLYYATEYKGADTVWSEVDENTKLFNEDALYEPGYTEIVYFKVENAGSLYLKYNMTLNIFNEKAGTNKAGQSFLLSNYLCADVLSPSSLAYTTDRNYIHETYNKETLNTFIYGDNYRGIVDGWREAKRLAPGESYECGLTIFMPTTVGNEANHNGNIPEIELGVSLVAIQSATEEDSFGDNYDLVSGDVMATPENAQEVIRTAEPGAVITLSAGHYGTLILENADGTPKSDITIKGQGGNASNCTVGAININSSTNVTLQDVRFDIAKAEAVYKKDGSASGYVSNIIGAKSGAATGAKDVVIDNCSFKTSNAYDASKYVSISFEEAGRPTSRATDIVVINCKLDKAAVNFARMNYMAEGTLYFKNNSICIQGEMVHNALNFTGNSANLVIKDNTFGNKSGFSNAVLGTGWNPDKSAIGSSRQGNNFITVEITGNTFINKALTAEGLILDLKVKPDRPENESYLAKNTGLIFSGNTYLGDLDGMTDATAPCVKP